MLDNTNTLLFIFLMSGVTVTKVLQNNLEQHRQCRIVQGICWHSFFKTFFYSYNIMFLSHYLYLLANVHVILGGSPGLIGVIRRHRFKRITMLPGGSRRTPLRPRRALGP